MAPLREKILAELDRHNSMASITTLAETLGEPYEAVRKAVSRLEETNEIGKRGNCFDARMKRPFRKK